MRKKILTKTMYVYVLFSSIFSPLNKLRVSDHRAIEKWAAWSLGNVPPPFWIGECTAESIPEYEFEMKISDTHFLMLNVVV